MRNVKVAALQFSCSDNIDENIKTCDELIKKAKDDGANIICIQELFSYLYFCQVEDYDYFSLALNRLDNALIKHYQNIAKQYDVVLPISFFEKDNNNFFNTIVVIDADGSIIDYYRKAHIPTGQCYEEKFYFTPGDTPFKTFKTKYGTIGVAVCWDQWFCEAARIMALKGAEILLYPTAIGSEPVLDKDSKDHWQNVMKGHAASNIMPVVASNRIGKETIKDSSMTFFGHSFICDEFGNIVKKLDDKIQGYIIYEFDLDKIEKERYSWGIFRDRRLDLYKDILNYSLKDNKGE